MRAITDNTITTLIHTNVTQTKGEVSNLDVSTTIDGREVKDNYQISGHSAGGNSGGPVVNEKGNVIGIARAKATDREQVSFAVKISHIKEALDQAMITYDEEIGFMEVGKVVEIIDTVDEATSVTANNTNNSVNHADDRIITIVLIFIVILICVGVTFFAIKKNSSLNEPEIDKSQDNAQKQEERILTKHYTTYKYMLKFFVKKDEQKAYESVSLEGISLLSNNKYPINADSFKLSNTSIAGMAINNADIGIEIGYGCENIVFKGKDCHVVLWNKATKKRSKRQHWQTKI